MAASAQDGLEDITKAFQKTQIARKISDEQSSLIIESIERVLRKTQLCTHWRNKKQCKFGASCVFAHALLEMRPTPPNAPALRKLLRECKAQLNSSSKPSGGGAQ